MEMRGKGNSSKKKSEVEEDINIRGRQDRLE